MDTFVTYDDLLTTYKTRSHRINHLKNYKHLFPVKTDINLAGIVVDLMGDGNLQKNQFGESILHQKTFLN